MINLWKEGFKTESYKVLSLTPLNEMELMILSNYCLTFMVSYDKEVTEEDGGKKLVKYQRIDDERVKSLLKSKDAEFIEKIDEMTQLLVETLGEEVTKSLKVFEMFFTIPSLQYEISEYKTSLKKK